MVLSEASLSTRALGSSPFLLFQKHDCLNGQPFPLSSAHFPSLTSFFLHQQYQHAQYLPPQRTSLSSPVPFQVKAPFFHFSSQQDFSKVISIHLFCFLTCSWVSLYLTIFIYKLILKKNDVRGGCPDTLSCGVIHERAALRFLCSQHPNFS